MPSHEDMSRILGLNKRRGMVQKGLYREGRIGVQIFEQSLWDDGRVKGMPGSSKDEVRTPPRKKEKEEQDEVPKGMSKALLTICPSQTEKKCELKYQFQETAAASQVCTRNVASGDIAIRLRIPPEPLAKGTTVAAQPWPGARVPMITSTQVRRQVTRQEDSSIKKNAWGHRPSLAQGLASKGINQLRNAFELQ